ncbi:MAG: KTSC domain-containing protein [Thermoplasmatales archaeon]|nr:MAG: KTSC domain-containing protein [Thermoplasmatales archaeon]
MSQLLYQIDKETSSLISDIRWYEGMGLYITFRTNNKMYSYKKVPKNIILGLVSAESTGKYFNKHIKNKYEYTIVGEQEY